MKKSKEEVIHIFGKDLESGPCVNCIGYSTNDPDARFGFSLDYEVLAIDFNHENKATQVYINAW